MFHSVGNSINVCMQCAAQTNSAGCEGWNGQYFIDELSVIQVIFNFFISFFFSFFFFLFNNWSSAEHNVDVMLQAWHHEVECLLYYRGHVVHQDRTHRWKGLATDETHSAEYKQQRRGQKACWVNWADWGQVGQGEKNGNKEAAAVSEGQDIMKWDRALGTMATQSLKLCSWYN